MTNYTGVVRRIFPNQFGSKKLYSFVIDSVDKTYFNLGEKAPNFSEGQTVQFDGTPGKRAGNVDVKVVEVVGEQPVTSESYSMASGARRSNEVITKDKYWENREANDQKVQRVIQIQAARNAAIAVMAASTIPELTDEQTEAFVNRWTDIFLANNEARLNG